jgi:hypothetical protein
VTAPRDLAVFELEQADVYIRDIWRTIFGDAPQPKRTQALQRIHAMTLRVDWPERQRKLPIGLVPDDETAICGECGFADRPAGGPCPECESRGAP